MTEEIINALAKVPGLQVSSRSSCFAFKGKQVDIREVGEKLVLWPLAGALSALRRGYTAAIAQGEKIIELDEDFFVAYLDIGFAPARPR